jgi:hypothetical protein
MNPRLLHPVPITLQQIVRGETVYDPDLREPIQNTTRTANAILRGQVKWGLDKALNVLPEGVKEGSDGYVLFRASDLVKASITINREDRFIKMGKVEVDVYVTALQPLGHYPDIGGHGLIRAYFKDKQPSRQSRGT